MILSGLMVHICRVSSGKFNISSGLIVVMTVMLVVVIAS